ncbi:hypothetical protein MKEN_00913500 [Mycena kentingensis (nom. inval.)]|nr:hypothetical protein MKEN_00913500 [Mycena kentingensis (nom. inval.)]
MSAPRPRPRPRPVAKTPTANATPTVVVDDSMFIRNKSRSTTDWQRLNKITDKPSKKKTARSDSEEDSSSPRPKKQKTKTVDAALKEMQRELSRQPESESDETDLEIVDAPSKKGKGKERRSRSRSLTPPPDLSEAQLRLTRNIVREALGTRHRRTSSPSPPPESNESMDTTDLDPEVQRILRAAHPQASRSPPTDSGPKETIELVVRWRPHPNDQNSPIWKDPVTWKIHRTDDFRRIIAEAAQEARITTASIVLSYNSARIFPSTTPSQLQLWTTAELEACAKSTWDYLRAQPASTTVVHKAPTSKPKPKPKAATVHEDDNGVMIISDSDDPGTPFDVDADEDESSDGGEAAAVAAALEEEPEKSMPEDAFKLILRSKLTQKDISLNVRPTTTCGAIVKGFLRKAGLLDQYPSIAGPVNASKGPRKSIGKGKKKGNEPEKNPQLQIDGDRIEGDVPIGDMDLEDGDVVDVVGL